MFRAKGNGGFVTNHLCRGSVAAPPVGQEKVSGTHLSATFETKGSDMSGRSRSAWSSASDDHHGHVATHIPRGNVRFWWRGAKATNRRNPNAPRDGGDSLAAYTFGGGDHQRVTARSSRCPASDIVDLLARRSQDVHT